MREPWRSRSTSSLFFAFATCLITACAGIRAPKLDYAEYAGEPVKSFYLDSADGWTAIGRDKLVVWSSLDKAYLITITGYCPDLEFADSIALTSTGHTVDRFEKVLVGNERCLIHEIRPIDTRRMKADRKLLREQRNEESRKETAPGDSESRTGESNLDPTHTQGYDR